MLSDNVREVIRTPGFERPSSALTARLDHLALRSVEPAALADFYGEAMGYEISASETGGYDLVGLDRRLAIVAGTASGLAYAAFDASDHDELERLRRRLRAAAVFWRDVENDRLSNAIAIEDPDGNTVLFGVASDAAVAALPSMAPPARLQHVVVASRDAARMTSFYTDVVGFSLSDNVVGEEGDVRTSFMRCSPEHHSLAVFQAAENRLDHHCYETSNWNDIRDWGDRLADRRIRVQWGPGRHGPGNNLFLFFHDADGNWVELSAELEIVPHDRPVGVWQHEERTLNSWGPGKLRS